MDERVGSRNNPVQKVRGIVFHPEGILLMRRIRKSMNGRGKVQYYVFPGGGRELGETLEQCVKREVLEETGVTVRVEKEFARLPFSTKEEIFFVCKYVDGEVGTGTGPEFTEARIRQRGLYIAEVVPLKSIAVLDLKPIAIKEKLLEVYGK